MRLGITVIGCANLRIRQWRVPGNNVRFELTQLLRVSLYQYVHLATGVFYQAGQAVLMGKPK
mgnify:CR=1 FL=1